MHLRFVAFLCFAVIIATARKLPSYIKICNRNDPEVTTCIKESYKIVFQHGVLGIPEMNIRPFNPVIIDKLSIVNGNGQSVNLDAQLNDVKLYGIQDSELASVKVDFDIGTFNGEIFTPAVYLESKFGANGKVLLFQFDSNGVFRANLTGVHSKVSYKFDSYQKKDKKYWKLADSDVDCVIDKFVIDIENLFGDNKELGDTTNKAINDNIDTLYEELKPVIVDTLKTILNDAATNVYNLFPFDVLHPE
ncbi:PREDICTED: circadian clock-controlled protein-like [Nicrophorus vespilloides]|uniref:Circadian clock-controlled protein-like n=1 Tax=Nicrophorus vespilloides TaxID=110193 RepID=A0ABM1MF63_NICVS|nr:PREDICTED: circadian clock-controlled protein-like [Nicrophorus vespilloides]